MPFYASYNVFLELNCARRLFLLFRRIDEKDVPFTPMPGHVAGFGALVSKIGRGFPRSISCGRDYSVVCTYPYEGPDLMVATRLMEEAKIREQEALLMENRVE
ncbi:hypothetical protein EON65_11440 [archaeon]|nr:MAG: hypothetical protein EON65_11440 [archaeon]